MSPDSILPHETAALVGAELAAGERIVWVGQPIPGRFARKSIGIVLFGIPWTAFAIFWMVGAGMGTWSVPAKGEDGGFFQIFRLFPLFGLPFVLIGIGMLSSPYWMRRKAYRTAYVITDRRALVFDAGSWRGTTIRSFEPDRLNDLRRVQNNDGSGDIIFERQWRSNSDGGKQSTDIGFLAIANVKNVEDSIRALISKANSQQFKFPDKL